MPIGVMVNSSAVLLGGLIGALVGNKIPENVKKALPVIFGSSAMAIGVTLIVKVKNLSAVVLALILGTIIGELIRISDRVEAGVTKLNARLTKNNSDQKYDMTFLTSALILFVAGATGIFGALSEGMTGDNTILLVKSILDFFTSMIFASSAGILISLISIPQFIFFMTMFFSASFIMPLTTPTMIADFSACGGIITFAVGFNILKIKEIKVLNILPAILLVMPISYLWTLLL